MSVSVKLGAQMFGLGEALLRSEEDTFARLKELGYDCFEPFLLPLKPEFPGSPEKREPPKPRPGEERHKFWFPNDISSASERLKAAGLDAPSAHVCFFPGQDPVRTAEEMNRTAELLGTRFFAFNGAVRTPDEAKEWAERFSLIQERLTPGLQALYHNHNMEMAPVPADACPGLPEKPNLLDVFLAETSPDVGLEMDYGWSWFGGAEFDDLLRYNSRMVIIHLKDFTFSALRRTETQAENREFGRIGEGPVYTREVLKNIPNLPVFSGLVVVDQDYDPDIFTSLETGAENVRRFLAE